jgi:mannose-6-phosphate isomerase-like protein (cupin superfamily)
MAHAGDRFEMPDGSVYEVLTAAAESGDGQVAMEFTLPPGSVAPPAHVHPTTEERFEILEGELDLMVGGEWRTLGVGETAAVAPGVPHTFKNKCGKTVRVHDVHSPGFRFEDYIEHIFTLVSARGIKGAKDPRLPFYLSMVMLEYPETIQPGRRRERIGIGALAGLGQLFRLRT